MPTTKEYSQDELARFLEKFDIDKFCEITDCDDREVAIVAMHKARCHHPLVSKKKRKQSRKWLMERGYEPRISDEPLRDEVNNYIHDNY